MIVAVDTGGTKTLVTAFSRDGVAGKNTKFQTPKDINDYLQTLKGTLKTQYGGQRIDAIVVAMPGTIINNVVEWCPNLGWQNFDVVRELSGTLGSAPVFIENDANLGGLGETRSRGPVPSSCMYVTVSTGIGIGIINNGIIDPDLRNSEAGHMKLEYDGKLMEWEDFASGRAIHDIYKRYAKDITDAKTWNEIAERISRGFLCIIPLIQPEMIVIGGSMGTYFDNYAPSLRKILDQQLPERITCPEIVAAKHPEQAVIYGCYYYAVDQLAS